MDKIQINCFLFIFHFAVNRGFHFRFCFCYVNILCGYNCNANPQYREFCTIRHQQNWQKGSSLLFFIHLLIYVDVCMYVCISSRLFAKIHWLRWLCDCGLGFSFHIIYVPRVSIGFRFIPTVIILDGRDGEQHWMCFWCCGSHNFIVYLAKNIMSWQELCASLIAGWRPRLSQM